MGFKKDDSGAIPKSSFSSSLVFTPCPLFGVQFISCLLFGAQFILTAFFLFAFFFPA